ncbi:MAG: hypothetical protein ABJF10_18960 [Chthoniobacter sp.]|uniref:hypothetical protein n=1 Tax=Chthoniobacter sp. TaxID=2510640 RepID=UPI0032ACAE25
MIRRRHFLQMLGGGALLAAHARAAEAPRKPPFRVLYSNDTTNLLGCASPWRTKGVPFGAELIEASVDEVAGLVDAHFLQPGLGEVPMWPSKVEPLDAHYRWMRETYGIGPDAFGQYVLAGGDVVKVFLDRCRARGQAAFISVRMNDAHHKEFVDAKPGDNIGGSLAMSVTKFYRDHPEYRIGNKLGSAQFQVLNWAIPEVRAHKFALLQELCENYDLDGLELDFMRFYNYFPRDQTTSGQRREIITGFVRDVRALLDRTARAGRRRWLCARIPGFISALDPLGLDVAALAAAGLDMLNLSASYFTTQQMEVAAFRALAPQTAIYVELCHSTWNGPKMTAGYDVFPFRRATVEQLETTAHLGYARGADGVSLFNFAYYREHGGAGRGPFHEPPFTVLPILGDRAKVAALPQHWFLAPGWENPFAKPATLPRKLKSGETTKFTLDLAPPVGGWKKDARLRVQTLAPMPPGQLAVKLNGTQLPPGGDIAEPFPNPDPPLLGAPETLAAWIAPKSLLRDGPNEVIVALESGGPIELVFLDLSVP